MLDFSLPLRRGVYQSQGRLVGLRGAVLLLVVQSRAGGRGEPCLRRGAGTGRAYLQGNLTQAVVPGGAGAPEPAEQGWPRALALEVLAPQGDTSAGVTSDPAACPGVLSPGPQLARIYCLSGSVSAEGKVPA